MANCKYSFYNYSVHRFLFLLFIVFLNSCLEQDKVQFEVAQPYGVKTSKSFGKRIMGKYINCSNFEDQLIITNKFIINYQTFKMKAHRNDLVLDSSINKNIDNEVKQLFVNEGFEFAIEGDTVYTSQTSIDTLFRVSSSQQLKKFKNNYFLNFKNENTFWDVSKLALDKDTLLIGQISPSDSLLHFDFVKKEALKDNKRNVYTINSTKKEFKKLLQLKSFNSCECYFKKK